MRPWLPLVFLLGVALPVALQARASESRILSLLSLRLPSRPMLCTLSGEEVRPDAALKGKPALLLFMDASSSPNAEAVRFLAGLQEEYAPWLFWAGVMVGPAQPEAIRRFHEESPLRLGYCWHDRDGFWASAFQLSDLPAAVLVTKEGYLVRRQTGFGPEDARAFTEELEHLVRASMLEGRPARDFRLPELAAAATKTLADLPLPDFTILLSLRSDCSACFKELPVLLEARGRHPDRLSVVTVDHDPAGQTEAASPAIEGAQRPDLLLRDPRMNLAERCFISGVPYLLMIDAGGKIVMARAGFADDEAAALAGEIERRLAGSYSSGEDRARFGAFRRIRQEALELLREGQPGMAAFYLERALELNPEYYTILTELGEAYQQLGKRRQASMAYLRYLSSEPLACDRQQIEERIRSLAAAP